MKKKSLSIIIILLFNSLLVCGQTINQNSKEYKYINESPEGIIYYKDELFSGKIVKYCDGYLCDEKNYKDGKLHGPYKIYHNDNRQIEFDYNFVNGKTNGIQKIYYESGQLYIIVNSKDDLEHGKMKMYRKNGQLWKEESFLDGKKNGPYKYYYENGSLMSEGNFKNGKRVGIQKIYYENGELEGEINYDNY